MFTATDGAPPERLLSLIQDPKGDPRDSEAHSQALQVTVPVLEALPICLLVVCRSSVACFYRGEYATK